MGTKQDPGFILHTLLAHKTTGYVIILLLKEPELCAITLHIKPGKGGQQKNVKDRNGVIQNIDSPLMLSVPSGPSQAGLSSLQSQGNLHSPTITSPPTFLNLQILSRTGKLPFTLPSSRLPEPSWPSQATLYNLQSQEVLHSLPTFPPNLIKAEACETYRNVGPSHRDLQGLDHTAQWYSSKTCHTRTDKDHLPPNTYNHKNILRPKPSSWLKVLKRTHSTKPRTIWHLQSTATQLQQAWDILSELKHKKVTLNTVL